MSQGTTGETADGITIPRIGHRFCETYHTLDGIRAGGQVCHRLKSGDCHTILKTSGPICNYAGSHLRGRAVGRPELLKPYLRDIA